MSIAHPTPKSDSMISSKLDCYDGVLASKRICGGYIDASRKDTSVESSHEAIDHSLANNSASEKSYNLSDETPFNSDLNRTVEKIMEVSHEGSTGRVVGRNPVLSLNDISDIFNKENKETEIVSPSYTLVFMILQIMYLIFTKLIKIFVFKLVCLLILL